MMRRKYLLVNSIMGHSLLAFTVTTLGALFPIANPISAVPFFYSLTADDSPQFRLNQARKTALSVTGVLIVSFLTGKSILSFLGISIEVLRIAGGLIVAHTAWKMVMAHSQLTIQEHREAIDKEDISFTPMAIPIISGPGAIGVVIGLATQTQDWIEQLGCATGIALLGLILYLFLVLGEPLIEKFGATGMGAFNRILGFLILAIAVQLIADGVLELLKVS